MSDRVYICGQAVHCALGDDIERVIDAMKTNRVQAINIPLSLIDSNFSRPYYRLSAKDSDRTRCSKKYFYDVLFDTIEAAIDDAGLSPDEIEALPVFFGSTSNDIPIYEDTYESSRNVLSQTSSGYGNIASEIANHFSIKAACYTFTTACTSSANGIIYAANMIVQGSINRALVVGYDLFCNLGFYGFESLKLISPSTCKPFDKTREGIIIGEGCGALILDNKSKTPNDFHYLGGANICDTYNVTTHNPAGDQIAAVMREALHRSKVGSHQINAVKAHATGSYHNDLTEGNGLKQIFRDQIPPVTGLKPFIGHTVGACGVIELVLYTEAIKRGFLPATLGFEEIDDEIKIGPITEPVSIQPGIFLLNYFGFGGNCVSLVVSNRRDQVAPH